MSETCKSCGKAWVDHLGVEPTCALLMEAVAILEEIGEPRDSLTDPMTDESTEYCAVCFTEEGHEDTCAIKKKERLS